MAHDTELEIEKQMEQLDGKSQELKDKILDVIEYFQAQIKQLNKKIKKLEQDKLQLATDNIGLRAEIASLKSKKPI